MQGERSAAVEGRNEGEKVNKPTRAPAIPSLVNICRFYKWFPKKGTDNKKLNVFYDAVNSFAYSYSMVCTDVVQTSTNYTVLTLTHGRP